MKLPGLVKQEDVEIVSPEGELRCHVAPGFPDPVRERTGHPASDRCNPKF